MLPAARQGGKKKTDRPCDLNTESSVMENISFTPDCDLAGVLHQFIKSRVVWDKDVNLSCWIIMFNYSLSGTQVMIGVKGM